MNGGYTIEEITHGPLGESFSTMQWLQIISGTAIGGLLVVFFCYSIWRIERQAEGGKPVKFWIFLPAFILIALGLISVPR